MTPILGVLLTPAVGAALAVVAGTRARGWVTAAATTATFVLSLALAGRLLDNGTERASLTLAEGVGFTLVADGRLPPQVRCSAAP